VTLKRLSLDVLKPHPRNPRIHPAPGSDKWEAMKASLKHDYFDPLVFNTRNGMLVSGHFRLKVMKEAGYTHADVISVDYDESTHIARMFAANKSAGENDLNLQRELFLELRELDNFDLTLTGFTLDEASVNFPTLKGADEEADDSDEPVEAGKESGAADSEAPEQEVRYLQLLLSKKDYTEVQALLGKVRAMRATELRREFPDSAEDALTLSCVVLYLLRKEVNS
jgi:ParB-like chromosome segregation protein Spo0J